MLRLVIGMGVAVALSGCSNGQEVRAWQPPSAPIYCYSTLAQSDCYSTPQAGARDRLIGFYGPRT